MEMDGSLALRSSQVSDHRAFARENRAIRPRGKILFSFGSG